MGKSQKLFPTLLILSLAIAPVGAEQFADRLYNLTGLPQIQPYFSGQEKSSERRFIAINAGYADIYRKKINGSTALTIAEQTNGVQFGWPFKTGEIRHILSGEYNRNSTSFDNLNDKTGLVSRLRTANTNYTMTWHMTGGIFQLGGRYEYRNSTTPFTIDITAFPQSENVTTNEYFFDLLEPTFGRELTNEFNMDQTSYSLWFSTRLSWNNRLSFAMRSTDLQADWQIRYNNTGPYAKLAGNRKIDWPLNGFGRVYKLSLFSFCQELSLTFFADRFSYEIDNNRPATSDVLSLGNGKFKRSGISIESRQRLKTWELASGLSIANYTADIFLKTPVLGYYLIFLPITHSAQLDISTSRSFSQQINITKRLKLKNISLDVGAAYTHTKFDFQVKGTADLMCGITSTNLDYPFQYSLHLFDFHANAEWRLGSFGLKYAIRQLIPLGKRLDNSPIHFATKTPGVEYVNRGGQDHQINLAYFF